jgi:hypothetical protein
MDNSHKSPLFLVSSHSEDALRHAAVSAGWTCVSSDELTPEDPHRIGLVNVRDTEDVQALRERYPSALMIATSPENNSADFTLDLQEHVGLIPQILDHAKALWRKNQHVVQLVQDSNLRQQRTRPLIQISLALTAQMPQQMLLRTILGEACGIVGCEGGSLFLIEPGENQSPSLVFKLTQNDKVEFPFVETRLPLSAESIAGYVYDVSAYGTDIAVV